MAYVPPESPSKISAPGLGWLTSRAVIAPVVAVIVFLMFWEFLVWVNGWPNYVMASPSDLPPAYSRYWGLFLEMGWQTLWRTVVGLVLAVLVGTLIGMVMGFSRTMRDALYPLLVGFNRDPEGDRGAHCGASFRRRA